MKNYNSQTVQAIIRKHNPNGLGGQFPHLDAKEPYVWIQMQGTEEVGKALCIELGGYPYHFDNGVFSFSVPITG